jgi:hypothetical protein
MEAVRAFNSREAGRRAVKSELPTNVIKPKAYVPFNNESEEEILVS